MNIDFSIALAVIGMSALLLHFKSHVKFVALGVFVGFTLIEIIPFEQHLPNPELESVVKILFLLVPAGILGLNHTVDKRKKANFIWVIIFVLVFTLFFLSSLGQLLPQDYQTFITDQSLIGWHVLNQFTWFTLAAAIIIMIDSIHHRQYIEKQRKKAKAKSSSKSKSSS